MRPITENILAIVELIRLGWITRFRFDGPYWKWRFETAFGRGWPEPKRERLRAILSYGRWVHQMRRLR